MKFLLQKSEKKMKKRIGEQVEKPTAVLKYNKYMGAVDRADMVLASVKCI